MSAGPEAREPGAHEDPGRPWMLQFQAGDDAAFERLVIYYRKAVEHFLYRYLSDRDRTEDLTQEVFVRVYRSRGRYVPSAGFKTWLFTIATRLALNEIRSIRRRRRVFAPAPDVDPMDGEASWEQRVVDHRELSPDARMERKELEGVVNELIEGLPPNQKAALILSRVEQLSYRQIADVLDVSVMAVKSLIMRARETLRGRLEPYLTAGSPEPKARSSLDRCGSKPRRKP